MTDLRTAAQQALDDLRDLHANHNITYAGTIAALEAALAQQAEPQDAELSAALGWPGGISNPVLDRKVLLQKVAALMQDKLWEDHRVRHLWDHTLAQQAEPVEPYCYVYEYDGAFGLHREFYPKAYNGHKPDRTVPVYTAPPQRKPLTEEEIRDLWSWSMTAEAERTATTQQHAFTRAVERAHGITDPQVADRLARHGIPMPGDPK